MQSCDALFHSEKTGFLAKSTSQPPVLKQKSTSQVVRSTSEVTGCTSQLVKPTSRVFLISTSDEQDKAFLQATKHRISHNEDNKSCYHTAHNSAPGRKLLKKQAITNKRYIVIHRIETLHLQKSGVPYIHAVTTTLHR